MDDSYTASDGTQWSRESAHKNGFSLWLSNGHWAAVCEPGELPSDGSVCLLPKERARRVFDIMETA